MFRTYLMIALSLCSTAALAQTAPAEAPPAPAPEAPQPPPPPPEPRATPEPKPPPPAAPVPATPPAPATPVVPAPPPGTSAAVTADGEAGLLQQKIDELAQKHDKLAGIFGNLKLSGYVQARYVYDERSEDGRVRDGFTVRRGRLKATYALEWSEYVLQIDATPRGVTLKDAEVHLIEPWTGHELELVAGQTKWPFGFEVLQSSSQREFPERSRVVRAFASGERDRGAKLQAKVGWFRFTGGVFDGNGIDNDGFEGVDNDRNKDVIGRVGVDFKWISGGVSGWYGRTFRPAQEAEEDAPSVPAGTFDRTRVGVDLQVERKLLPFGATALRAEFIAGRTYFKDGVEQFGVPALGWYAVLIQRIGEDNAVALRYDRFDPSAGVEDAASRSDASRPSSTNAVSTFGVAYIHEWNKSLRLTAAYEVPTTLGPASVRDPADSTFILQAQAKF